MRRAQNSRAWPQANAPDREYGSVPALDLDFAKTPISGAPALVDFASLVCGIAARVLG